MSDQPKKPKPYSFTEEGGILFRSTRTVWDVRIPSWVYDLWMPLLGAEAMGVYTLYCRLEMYGAVRKISLRDLATAFRIGYKRLNDIHDMLQDCGFITVNKPQGLRRVKHWTTEIQVHDPAQHIPIGIIEKYQHPQGYKPVTTWLVAEVEQIAEALGSASEDIKHQVVLPETPVGVSMIEDLEVDHDLDQSSMHGDEPEPEPTQSQQAPDMHGMDVLSKNPSYRLLKEYGIRSDKVLAELAIVPVETIQAEWALVKNSSIPAHYKPNQLAKNLRGWLVDQAENPEPEPIAVSDPKPEHPSIARSDWQDLGRYDRSQALSQYMDDVKAWNKRNEGR